VHASPCNALQAHATTPQTPTATNAGAVVIIIIWTYLHGPLSGWVAFPALVTMDQTADCKSCRAARRPADCDFKVPPSRSHHGGHTLDAFPPSIAAAWAGGAKRFDSSTVACCSVFDLMCPARRRRHCMSAHAPAAGRQEVWCDWHPLPRSGEWLAGGRLPPRLLSSWHSQTHPTLA
jgi:hypothetical protein